MQPHAIARWSELDDRTPTGALVGNVDLVIVRFDDDHSVLHGRCQHRGALLADGSIRGDDLICGVHGWDYRFRTGDQRVRTTTSRSRSSRRGSTDDQRAGRPRRDRRHGSGPTRNPGTATAYQGAYQDPHGAPEEPFVAQIRELATNGLSNVGHHGAVTSMGVPRDELPILGLDPARHRPARPPAAARRHRGRDRHGDRPGRRDAAPPRHPAVRVRHELRCAVAGGQGRARTRRRTGRHRHLLGRGRHAARGTRGELALLLRARLGRFGWSLEKVRDVQAFHFKFGQGAKTGTGGHLPGNKVIGRIAEVRGLEPGTPAVSPATFPDLTTIDDYRALAAEVRAASGGIPIGAKLSAQHIEADIDAALEIGVDYVILDGRGGGTGAAPKIFRDHISVPTIPALARARRHLDRCESGRHARHHRRAPHATPTSSRRSRSAPTRSRCRTPRCRRSAASACGRATPNNCPVGIATQKPGLRQRLVVEDAAQRLTRFFGATVELMQVLARACGHSRLADSEPRRPHHVRPRDAPPRRHPLRRHHAMSDLTWHKILEPDQLDEGRVTTVSRSASDRSPSRSTRASTAASTTRARTRADRSARARSRTACSDARGTATTTPPSTGQPPEGFSDAPACFPTEVRDDGVYVALPPEPAAARTVSDVIVETLTNWGLTHVFGMVGHSNLGFADAMRKAEDTRRPDVRRHPPRGCCGLRRLGLRQADRPGRGLFRHRRARLHQPADRPVRRQGGPLAGPRDLRSGALEGARAAARSRTPTSRRRSRTWPRSARPCRRTSDHAELANARHEARDRRARRRAPHPARRGPAPAGRRRRRGRHARRVASAHARSCRRRTRSPRPSSARGGGPDR